MSGGRLAANGSLLSSSGVTVGVGGTLGGTGSVPSTVVMGALAPGNSIGTITVVGNLTFTAGSALPGRGGRRRERPHKRHRQRRRWTAPSQATLLGHELHARSATPFCRPTGGLAGRFRNLTAQGLRSFLLANLGYSHHRRHHRPAVGNGIDFRPGRQPAAPWHGRSTPPSTPAPDLNGMPGLYGLVRRPNPAGAHRAIGREHQRDPDLGVRGRSAVHLDSDRAGGDPAVRRARLRRTGRRAGRLRGPAMERLVAGVRWHPVDPCRCCDGQRRGSAECRRRRIRR